MITGLLHPGSGIGNQLHRYVAIRVLALDKGYDFSMAAPENFKGIDFMNLDMGKPTHFAYHTESPPGKVVVDYRNLYARGEKMMAGLTIPLWEEKTNYYNPEFNFIEDDTIIDGEFQDPRYFEHRLKDIDKWLAVEPLEMPDDLCVIGFRGGEFTVFPDLFLTKEYWAEAKILMLQKNINMRFEVHTDDEVTAQQFFPDLKVIHNVALNWRSVRFAKHAIIANSSFFILPRLLSGGDTLAPRYWARRNIKEWSMPQNYYKQFKYI